MFKYFGGKDVFFAHIVYLVLYRFIVTNASVISTNSQIIKISA